jgi:hypothetical protein
MGPASPADRRIGYGSVGPRPRGLLGARWLCWRSTCGAAARVDDLRTVCLSCGMSVSRGRLPQLGCPPTLLKGGLAQMRGCGSQAQGLIHQTLAKGMFGFAFEHGDGALPCPGPAFKGLGVREELRLVADLDHWCTPDIALGEPTLPEHCDQTGSMSRHIWAVCSGRRSGWGTAARS